MNGPLAGLLPLPDHRRMEDDSEDLPDFQAAHRGYGKNGKKRRRPGPSRPGPDKKPKRFRVGRFK